MRSVTEKRPLTYISVLITEMHILSYSQDRGLKLFLSLYIPCANSDGSGETAHMHKLACTVSFRIYFQHPFACRGSYRRCCLLRCSNSKDVEASTSMSAALCIFRLIRCWKLRTDWTDAQVVLTFWGLHMLLTGFLPAQLVHLMFQNLNISHLCMQ